MSTGSIEAVLAGHPAVAECAVIGVADEIKGQVPRGFVVLKAGATAERLADELVEAVRENIGAVACFKLVDVVPALPKTRSGKILRKTMRGIADGRDEPVPSTIEDPAVLDALKPILVRDVRETELDARGPCESRASQRKALLSRCLNTSSKRR